METEKIKLKIKKIIYAKETQPYEWRKAIYLLNKLKEAGIDNQYYDLTMAKILLKFNIIAEAKYFLTNMIDNGYEQASTYYHLYKIDVLEGNFEDAYLDLFVNFKFIISNNFKNKITYKVSNKKVYI